MNIRLPKNITAEQITNSFDVSDNLCSGKSVTELGCYEIVCVNCALDNNDNRDLYLEQNKKISKEENELINIEDTYADGDGNIVRILCVDAEDLTFPVIALVYGKPLKYTSRGSFYTTSKSHKDLAKIEPYKDFKVDDKFVVWDKSNDKFNRYFSHLDKGVPNFFSKGKTSFSTNGLTKSWNNFERCEE